MPEPIFYSCDEGAEYLTNTDPDEAIENHLDNFWPALYEYPGRDQERIDAFVKALPEEIEVFGYARREFEDRFLDADCILERIFEHLEEDELGDPDGRSFEHAFSDGGKSVTEAAKQLVNAVRDTYEPWTCEIVETTKIKPLDWIREHSPEWLVVEGSA